MRIAGIVLVGLGVLALLYGGITYTRQNTVLEVGALKVTRTERKSIPIPAIVGIVALVGGIALMMSPAAKRNLR